MQFFIQVHTCCSAHTPYLPEVLQRGREGGAEREGDKEGGGETEEERRKRRRRDGEFVGGEWGSIVGKMGGGWDFGRRGVEDDGYSRGREERENGGITRYVNERGRLIRARENNQQLTMATSGHINISLQHMKACSQDQGRTRKNTEME